MRRPIILPPSPSSCSAPRRASSSRSRRTRKPRQARKAQEQPCRPTSIRNRDSACRCRSAKIWMKRARRPTTAARRLAPPSPACRVPPACSSSARRRAAHGRAQPLSALRGRALRRTFARSRSSPPRARWTASSNGSRTSREALKEGVPQSTIDVIKYRRSTEGDRSDRCAHHRARPPALARPQGEVGNLRQAQGHLRAEQADRTGHADGQLCRYRRAARGRRHATARREKNRCCRFPRPSTRRGTCPVCPLDCEDGKRRRWFARSIVMLIQSSEVVT